MASFSLSQEKDKVEYLGRDIFHDTKGHNILTADISGQDLSHAWLEFSLNGEEFQKLKEFNDSDYQYPFNNPPDGTALSDISARESFDIRWESNSQDKLVFYYSEQHDGTSQKIRKAVSSNGDPTSFDDAGTVVLEESDKAEDPNLFHDPETDNLYLVMEDSDPHGQVAILEADSTSGETFTKKKVVGEGQWDLSAHPASPMTCRYNGTQLLMGEDHSRRDQPLMVASGPDIFTWEDYIISIDSSEYSDIHRHVNIQGPCFIDRNGNFHAYSDIYDGSEFHPVHVTTNTFDSENRPTEPWDVTIDKDSQHFISGLIRFVNSFYSYRERDFTDVEYWEIPGSTRLRDLSSDGGTVSWEWYEPTAPPGSNVEWRVAVEDTSGNVERSGTMEFNISGTSTMRVQAGEVLTVESVVQNDGTESGTQDVTLNAGSNEVDSLTGLSLSAGEEQTVSLDWNTDSSDVGSWVVSVNSNDDEDTMNVEVVE